MNSLKRLPNQPDDLFTALIRIQAGASVYSLGDGPTVPRLLKEAVYMPANPMSEGYWQFLDGNGRWYVARHHATQATTPDCAYCSRTASQVKNGRLICRSPACEHKTRNDIKPDAYSADPIPEVLTPAAFAPLLSMLQEAYTQGHPKMLLGELERVTNAVHQRLLTRSDS